jgi:hypothetical protein
VDFRYADGSTRRYEVPAYAGADPWRGLDRLFAHHEALPHLPFAGAAAPVRLGAPRRPAVAPAPPEAQPPGTASADHWSWAALRQDEAILWAPDGQSILLRFSAPSHAWPPPIWLVRLDGTPPRRLADRVEAYTWSADGHRVAALQRTADRVRLELVAIDPATGALQRLTHSRLSGGQARQAALAAAGDAVYVLHGSTLWRKPLDDGPEARLALPAEAAPATDLPRTLAVSPDGQRAAYACDRDACLVALSHAPGDSSLHGRPLARLPLDANGATLAWSPDGERLAAGAGSARLWIVDRDGRVEHALAIGPPSGEALAPQWTPDGRFVFVTTFPAGGRRIVAVDVEQGQVFDLSRPRWDASASLAPDGEHLLLWNGRGGPWLVPLERQTRAAPVR